MFILLKRELKIWWPSMAFRLGYLLWLTVAIGLPLYIFYLKDRFTRLTPFQGAYTFPIILNTISVINLASVLILCVLMIMLVCQEFEFGTCRMHVLNGVSRRNLWLIKVQTAGFLSLSLFIVTLLLSIILGGGSITDFSINSLKWPALLLYQSFIYMNFSIATSLAFKKTGISILIFVLWFIVIERIFAHIINYMLGLHPLGMFLPGKCVEDLTHLIALDGMIIYSYKFYPLRLTGSFVWLSLTMFYCWKFYQRHNY